MLQEMTYIELSGEKMPIRMDNLIVQLIQETYGTIKRFEYGLIGIKEKEDGTQEKCEPSVAIMNFILPKMIEEGYRVMGEEPKHSDIEILRMIDMNPYELSGVIHEEMVRCFTTKKHKPSQKTRKTDRLTMTGFMLSAFQRLESRKKK